MSLLATLSDKATLAVISLKGQTGLPEGTQDIGDATTKTVNYLMGLIGALAIIFIVVGGVQMVTAAGSPQRIKQARETIIYSVVGLLFALGAYAVVLFINSKLK